MTTTYTGPESGVMTFEMKPDIKSHIQALLKWDYDKESLKVEDGKIILGDGRMLPSYIIRELGLKEHSVLKTFSKYYSYTLD